MLAIPGGFDACRSLCLHYLDSGHRRRMGGFESCSLRESAAGSRKHRTRWFEFYAHSERYELCVGRDRELERDGADDDLRQRLPAHGGSSSGKHHYGYYSLHYGDESCAERRCFKHGVFPDRYDGVQLGRSQFSSWNRAG
jgi:hypothetical protein